MKLHFLDRSSLNNSSFSARVNEYSNFLKVWHYHPEMELVVILKSQGTCFVGDSIEKFKPKDIVLIGKNLPHMWQNDPEYFNEDSQLKAKAVSVHFKKDFLGSYFFETPEMIHLLELFERAKFGLKFLNVPNRLINEITKLPELDGFNKTIAFLQVLNQLAKYKDTQRLTSYGFVNAFSLTKSIVQDKVQAYIFNNFNKDISLEEAAKIANMNASAFSRYFKRVNRKTFSKYVTEIRVGYACKLLIESKFNIAAVCFESGFKNISNFNRQFKVIMNCTPSEFLKNYKSEASQDENK
ncbi:AraC family transcriptional regulator [Tamlana sp. 62-3]|uniref:AraC family transcriptional regulator n=1 Tax=Neotamlana sargassicola TaxID=2883125 RepID=A0A9X1L7P4_9FLAO|nr:AraC family transcriptional regulator [Tamlana sargassicola]MCB4807963.1 AraC family transcriptional regulator [Tamlana sargassicola]